MSVEIAWKQNILVTDFHLLKSLLVVLGFSSQAFVCGFSRQNINSVDKYIVKWTQEKFFSFISVLEDSVLGISLEHTKSDAHYIPHI